MDETHIIIALVVVLVLFLIYKFWWCRKSKKPDSKTKSSSNKDKEKLEDIDPGDDSDFEEEEEDARDLYRRFHHRFVNGIDEDEFKDLADDEDGTLWLKLSQLYDLSRSQGMDPATYVRVEEYRKVL